MALGSLWGGGRPGGCHCGGCEWGESPERSLSVWTHWSLLCHSLLPPASCAHLGPLPRMASTTGLCLPKSYPSVILALCCHLCAVCSDFSALSPVPLPEASALPCLQLPLELGTSVSWGSWGSGCGLLFWAEARPRLSYVSLAPSMGQMPHGPPLSTLTSGLPHGALALQTEPSPPFVTV